jgi:hypothetical protein
MKQKNLLKIVTLFLFTIFTINSNAQSTIYSEDFTGQNGKGAVGPAPTTDLSGVDWTIDISSATLSASSDWFKVTNEIFEARDIDGNAIWQSKSINISGFSNVSFSLSAVEAGGMESSDIFNTEYRIDGGTWTTAGTNGNLNDDFTSATVSQTGLSGSTLEIRVTMNNGAGTEYHRLDDILVEGTASSDPIVGFDAATSSETETDASFNVSIPVTVSNYGTDQIDVSVAVSGSAEVADYTLNTASLSFTSDGSQNISLDINPDIDDYDDETITLTLTETSSVSGLVISQSTHTLTVADDESAPSIGFDTATSSETETDATFNVLIPFIVSNYSGNQIDVNVASSGTAEGGDFTLNTASLSFTADGSQNISLDINDDADTDEETVILTITETSAVSGLVISQSTHTVTITDDEIPPVPIAGTVFITEFSDDKGGDFNSEFIELFNNSNETISLSTSKLIRAAADNSSEYVYDFGADESTADDDVTIPAYGFIIITRGATRAEFDTDQGTTLNAAVKYNGGNISLYFGHTSRRWRLMTGGTSNTDDGTLIDDTGAVLSVTRDYQNIFTDTFVSDSDANGTPGTLEYLVYSGGAWVNTTAMDATTAAKDAYIYDDYTVSANAAANNIGINTGKTLTVNSSIGLDIDGNLTVNGNMSINSGGSLIVDGTSTGNVTYNRTLDFVSGNANGWHLISSPVAAQTYNNDYAETNGLATSGTKRGLAFYNDALASGSKYTYLLSDDSNTSSFNTGVYSGSGIGYSAKRASTTGTVAFTGTINTDDVNDVAVSTSGDGFNLLGVPYTSYISSQTFLTDNSNLEQTQIWVWEQGVTGGNFIAMTAKADNFILAPGQGFFVKAASGTTVNFAETNQTANADTFLKSSRTEVKLLINDGESNRFAKVYFLNNVTKGFDSGYEGETFGGIKNSLDLFSQLVEGNQGKKYQVQSLPKSDLESMVIPIGVIADAGKEITFTADALNVPSGLKVFLEDRQTNTFTRLDEANSEYKIMLTETLNGVGRFYMHTTASVLSTEDIILNSVRIFKTDSSTLKITGLPKGKTSFYLYNILGKEMMTTIFTSNGNKEISLSKLASGIYLAKIQTEKGAISKKIILE